MSKEFSAKEQKVLFKRLGYDISKWKPDDPKEEKKVLQLVNNALLNGVDAQHKSLSADDLLLLSAITGR